MYVLLFNVSKKSVVMQLLVCIGLKEFVAIYAMRDTVTAIEIDWECAAIYTMRDTVTAVEIDWEFTVIYTMRDTVTAVKIDWEFAAIYTMRDTVTVVEIDLGIYCYLHYARYSYCS